MDENEFTDGKNLSVRCLFILLRLLFLAEASLNDIIGEYQQISNYDSVDSPVEN